MFVITQFLLRKSNVCKHASTPMYSIALGLVIYASIYLYLLFRKNDYIYIFNKIIIYVVGLDLLASFLYFKTDASSKNDNKAPLNCTFETLVDKKLVNNNNAKDKEYESESDGESDSESESESQSENESVSESENEHEQTTQGMEQDDLQQQLDQLLAQGKRLLAQQEPQQVADEQVFDQNVSEHSDIAGEVNDTLGELPKIKRRGRPPKASL